MIAIVTTVTKQERIRISELVKAGLSTARHKGERLRRPPSIRFPLPDRSRGRAGTQYQHSPGSESVRCGVRVLIPRDPLLVRHEPLHSGSSW